MTDSGKGSQPPSHHGCILTDATLTTACISHPYRILTHTQRRSPHSDAHHTGIPRRPRTPRRPRRPCIPCIPFAGTPLTFHVTAMLPFPSSSTTRPRSFTLPLQRQPPTLTSRAALSRYPLPPWTSQHSLMTDTSLPQAATPLTRDLDPGHSLYGRATLELPVIHHGESAKRGRVGDAPDAAMFASSSWRLICATLPSLRRSAAMAMMSNKQGAGLTHTA